MSSNKDGSGRTKKKYRSDGTPIWERRNIDGPGVWVTCVRGKERQTVGEVCDLFESIADELWPEEQGDDHRNQEEEEDLEKAIANELAAMKRPKSTRRFQNCHTQTECLLFIACKKPVDPVELVYKHLRNVAETGVTHTRHAHRFVPVSASAVVNIPEIQALCRRIITPAFEALPGMCKYKIEIKVRNHHVIPRDTFIQEIAKSVPEGHTVDLAHPELTILVEVFKSVCGISVVKDYYELKKFSALELAKAKEGGEEEGRVKAKESTSDGMETEQ